MSSKLQKASPMNNSFTSPNVLNQSDQLKFLKPDSQCRNFSPFVRNQLKTPNISPIIKPTGSASSFLKKRSLKELKGRTENAKARRQTFSFYPSDEIHNQLMDLTLSVKTVLKDLGLSDYSDTFYKEELFRKLSLKSSTESSSNEYKAKYQPQKNHSITISPSSNGHSRMKRSCHKNNSTRHKKSKNDDVDDDDDDFTVPDRKRQSYIKSCIKKRLNNNYEKQINCIQDENVVFTDNKIYISLSARNHSSLGSNNSLKKNRRIIYPTSGPCKLNGFLRHYDFSYDDDNNESEPPTKSAIENSEEKLKFNMMNEQQPCLSTNSLDNVVFEKVKVKQSSPCSSNSNNNYESPSSYIHVTNNNDDERNDDSILTSSTFITSYEADDEDDIQWKNFLELRKHGKPINNNVSQLNDSGFGSQLFFSSNYNNNNNNNNSYNNIKALDTWQDDETYDNSFNEELEQRVSIMFPDLYKASSQSAHFNNINNINHITAEKLT